MRPDPQRALLHPRHRAAAGADLENIHHRDLHRQRLVVAADQSGTGGERFAIMDDPGLRRGATFEQIPGFEPAHVDVVEAHDLGWLEVEAVADLVP